MKLKTAIITIITFLTSTVLLANTLGLEGNGCQPQRYRSHGMYTRLRASDPGAARIVERRRAGGNVCWHGRRLPIQRCDYRWW